MTDILSAKDRSRHMSRIRAKNTKPEWHVRRLVFSLGYRYRLHQTTLPGRPDLVFPGRRKVIFVHGCFWHQHSYCKKSEIPKSNSAFWEKKLKNNFVRDQNNLNQLANLGWQSLVIWECEIRRSEGLGQKISAFLNVQIPK